MKKKLITAIVLAVSAVVLVVSTVFATVAFLAASSAVSNTFTVGDVEIDMRETPVDNEGQKEPGAGKTADGNSYRLVPGKTYDKDPTVFILPNCEPCYLFVRTNNGIASLEYDNDPRQMKKQMFENGWVLLGQLTTTGDNIFVYCGSVEDENGNQTYDKANNAPQAIATAIPQNANKQVVHLFETFTVRNDLTETALKHVGGSSVTLSAYAIQTTDFTTDGVAGLKDDVLKAWNTLKTEFDSIQGDLTLVPELSN